MAVGGIGGGGSSYIYPIDHKMHNARTDANKEKKGTFEESGPGEVLVKNKKTSSQTKGFRAHLKHQQRRVMQNQVNNLTSKKPDQKDTDDISKKNLNVPWHKPSPEQKKELQQIMDDIRNLFALERSNIPKKDIKKIKNEIKNAHISGQQKEGLRDLLKGFISDYHSLSLMKPRSFSEVFIILSNIKKGDLYKLSPKQQTAFGKISNAIERLANDVFLTRNGSDLKKDLNAAKKAIKNSDLPADLKSKLLNLANNIASSFTPQNPLDPIWPHPDPRNPPDPIWPHPDPRNPPDPGEGGL